MIRKSIGRVALATAAIFHSGAAFAQEAAEAAAPVANPGNNAWMMTATILVLLMILPGLALFYHDAGRWRGLPCHAYLGGLGLFARFRGNQL